jgi:hypothetical protein
LALLYQKQGRYADAESLHVATLEKRKRVLGEEHPDTLTSMHELTLLYQIQGRHDEARPLISASLEAKKKRAEATTDAKACNAYAWLALTCEWCPP